MRCDATDEERPLREFKMGPVSVIIPVYNRSAELRRAIRSVQAQSYADFELIVVDDASTDNIAGVVDDIGDPRVRLIRKNVNQGAASARNTGIEAATGRWVAFLDSDDEWLPHKLERQIERLAGHPKGARICCSGYVILHLQERREREFRPSDWHGTARQLIWGCNLSPGSTLIAERACFAEIGLFDVTLRRFEDWDWLLRYLRRYPIAIEPDVLARINKDSMPSHGSVLGSLELLRAKHQAALSAESWTLGRKFRSSLLVEEAAAAFYARRFCRTSALLTRALIAYPFRNRAFYAMLARRLGGVASLPSPSPGAAPGRFGKITERAEQ
jgi:glycosyltransferase involved in cell wall biosynthesis